MARPARLAGPRPPGPGAKCAPGRGARVRGATDVLCARSPPGPRPGRRVGGPGVPGRRQRASAGGRPPRGLARIADLLPPQQRVAPARGGLESPEGISTSPAQSAKGVVFALGNRDGSAVTRAHQAGQLDSIPTSGLDPVACLVRTQRGGHAPAAGPCVREIAREPSPTRTGFVDQDQGLGLGVPRVHTVSKGAWLRAHGAKADDLGRRGFGDIGDGERVWVDSHVDVRRASLGHG